MTDNKKTFPSIIYIMGTGRSGTTVLEILLSGNDEVCSVGELTHIFRDGFGIDKTCACGAPFSQCNFWSKVKQHLSYSPKKILQSSILFNKIDWHIGFLKILFNCISPKNIGSYFQINKELCDACISISGKKIIVDSSKYPARGFALNKLYGPAVKIICLTRSPEGLLNAFQKKNIVQPSKSSFGVFLYYTYVLFCCRVIAILTNNVLFISFEELIAFPIKTLKSIETFTGVSLDQTRCRINEGVAFTPGHIVTGNRLKNNKMVYFQKGLSEPQKKNQVFLLFMKVSKKLLGF